MLMAHTMSEDELSLNALAKKYLGKEKLEVNVKNLLDIPVEKLQEYCLKDCELTYELWQVLLQKIMPDQERLYRDEALPLYKNCTIPMKYNGIQINEKYFQKLRKDLTKKIGLLEEQVYSDIWPHIHEQVIREIGGYRPDPIKPATSYWSEDIEWYRLYNKWLKKNPDLPYVFNINSNKQLAWLIFEHKNELIPTLTISDALHDIT
jgi:DNA polymerase I-like protein with 3'-5' exonuclease and polymerase domains